jgi:hypothetical protein
MLTSSLRQSTKPIEKLISMNQFIQFCFRVQYNEKLKSSVRAQLPMLVIVGTASHTVAKIFSPNLQEISLPERLLLCAH